MTNNEDIDFESLEPEPPVTTLYNERGSEADGSEKILSKKVEHSSGKIAYFISHYRGTLFDPWGASGNKNSRSGVELKKTSLRAFELYLRYLKTRDKSSLILAERKHTHG